MALFADTAPTDVDLDPDKMSQAPTESQQALQNFWNKVTDEIRNMNINDFKQQELPLARIKKIMKLDDDVKMISAEAPVLFAKAAEIFIHELTLRAWIHTEDNKRRTLQRNDIAMAITKFDQFDFLIDIVPRDDLKPAKAREDGAVRTTSMLPDQVQYYFQLAQQQHAALQQSSQAPSQTPQTVQIVQQGGQVQTISVLPSPASSAAPTTTTTAIPVSVPTVTTQDVKPQPTLTMTQPTQTIQVDQSVTTPSVATVQQPQVIQIQAPQQQAQQVATTANTAAGAGGGIQIIQQIVGPSGEIQQIPIQLTQAQLQMIRMQIQGGTNQPIIIHTAPIQTVQQQQQQQQVAAQGGQPQIIQIAASQANGSVFLTQQGGQVQATHDGSQE